MVTHWESEEAFQAWATGPAIEAHAGQRRQPGRNRIVAAGVRGCVGRCGHRRRGVGLRAPLERAAAALVAVVPRVPWCVVVPHRRQHRPPTPTRACRSAPTRPPGVPRQADHGHAQLRLADRSDRSSTHWRRRTWSSRSIGHGQPLVGPAVHASRVSISARAGRRCTCAPPSAQNKTSISTPTTTGWSTGSTRSSAPRDQFMGRCRRRAGQLRRPVLVPGRQGNDGDCARLRAPTPAESLPLASIFKLYVLTPSPRA